MEKIALGALIDVHLSDVTQLFAWRGSVSAIWYLVVCSFPPKSAFSSLRSGQRFLFTRFFPFSDSTDTKHFFFGKRCIHSRKLFRSVLMAVIVLAVGSFVCVGVGVGSRQTSLIK